LKKERERNKNSPFERASGGRRRCASKKKKKIPGAIILLAGATTDVGCKETRIHRLALLARVQLPPNKLRQGFLSNNSLYGQARWYRLFFSLSLSLSLSFSTCVMTFYPPLLRERSIIL
jgi:hypothetical protein